MSQNWRTEVDAGDYFLHQKKQLALADRRPVPRRPSDLAGMGPGFGATAIRVEDLDSQLAQYNGFFSCAPNTPNAPPTPVEQGEAFVGVVVSDSEFGGVQKFTGITTGDTYQRVFRRAPADPQSVTIGSWVLITDGGGSFGSI